MSFQEYKIADSDISEKGVVAAPDKLTGKAQENKMVFDRLIREAVKEHYNRLIDALEAAGANAIIQTGSGDSLRWQRPRPLFRWQRPRPGIRWHALLLPVCNALLCTPQRPPQVRQC